MNNAQLYLILDTDVADYDRLLYITKEALAGGVDIMQLRDKRGLPSDIIRFSRKLLSLLKGKVPLIINDRVDLVLAAQADGVHLGQDDFPLEYVQKILPKEMIVGISCQTLGHARKAQRQGADYIGFGSVFKTLTKPYRAPMDLNLLSKVAEKIKIPVFAIGGIGSRNISLIRQAGVRRVAVCREICLSNDVRQTTKDLKQRLI